MYIRKNLTTNPYLTDLEPLKTRFNREVNTVNTERPR